MPHIVCLTVVTRLLVFLQIAGWAACQSSSDDWDPFLATDIPTASDTSNTIAIYSSSIDLDSSDYLDSLSTVSYSSPELSSSDSWSSAFQSIETTTMTATTSISVTSGDTTILITTTATTITTALNSNSSLTSPNPTPTTVPTTNSTNCAPGSGICFFVDQKLGAHGSSIHGQTHFTHLLIVLVLIMLSL